ncbi:acyl carrier protein [Spirillospora sp. CA-255316]|jgi:act minimal PKS acyl carrier protein
MSTTEMTLPELKETLLAAAGESEGVDLDGDIADVPFADLGYDSLAILETGGRVEKKYGISLDDDDITSAETPGELLKLINASLA